MMYAATLIRNTVHSLGIDQGGGLALLDQAGRDVLLAILRRPDEAERIVVNSAAGGVWGAELKIRFEEDPAGPARISFKFTSQGIELWTSAESRVFEGFDATAADHVGFARLDHCHCEGNTLRSAFEPVYKTVSDIEGYILCRRLEALEAQVQKRAQRVG